jgi:formylglycine-generating enzyme required for sulfatase activity
LTGTAADLFRCDEPTATDTLGRQTYVTALARLAETCETPMVVGLYGTWGIGKTSLMRQIQAELKSKSIGTVWFDPWRHQFDEDPIIALLQTMVMDLGRERSAGVREILATVGFALGSAVTKNALGLSFDDVRKIGQFVAEEEFRVRSARIRLRQSIGELITKARDDGGRIVFFIDDLDRCMPDTILKMLEALKLYLGVEHCVYFLGIDHGTVRKAIDTRYAQLAVRDREYLDKIVQIPFLIPPIAPDRALAFIESLLPERARDCAGDLVDFLGDNPRAVKRFVNVLSVNLLLYESFLESEQVDARLAAALLMIQQRNETLWKQIAQRPGLYRELTEAGEEAEKRASEAYGIDPRLHRLIRDVGCGDDTPIDSYVHVADVAGASVRAERTLAIEPEMVIIEPGVFEMGSPADEQDRTDAEGPQHEVTIGRRFALGKYPVTFAEYDAFCSGIGRPPPDDRGWGRGRRPVIMVSWHDAQAYCEWLFKETGKPYRLPSEAEWEYACRAGTTTPYSCADTITDTDANFGRKVGSTTEVGTYPPNPWGLYDMHGNVWEWIEDVRHDTYEGAPADGSAWTDGEGKESARVLRGGSWNNNPRLLRSAKRLWFAPDFRNNINGFRVARTLS